MKLFQTLTTLYAGRSEWMPGSAALFASLHHRWHIGTCCTVSPSLHLIEQPQWTQLAADRLGSYRKHEIDFSLKTHRNSLIPLSLLKNISISKKMLRLLLSPCCRCQRDPEKQLKTCAIRTAWSHWTRHTVWTDLWLSECTLVHSDCRPSPAGLHVAPV